MNNIDRLKLEVTTENTDTDNAIETLKNLSTISDGVEVEVRGLYTTDVCPALTPGN